MRTNVITGAAGGMGIAIRNYLEEKGEKVIGVDIRDAEVIADLSTVEGRKSMIKEIGQLSGGKIDGLVAGAGVSNTPQIPGDLMTSVNYFGAVATLEGLRPILAKSDSPRAVAIGSNSMSVIPIIKNLLDLFTSGNESGARELSNQFSREEPGVYATTKLGLAQWVRKKAITKEWIGNEISLNIIAPGLISTPMNPEERLAEVLKLGKVYPIPANRSGTSDEVAALVGYLLSENSGFMSGSVIFMDGGTESVMRSIDSPAPIAVV
ncbi:MAG: SDR family oxidoreductase [Anderseniella sp.]